ncbi:YbjQ family protein [Rhodoblastus sp.]|uniref:YbjQ family protein n=1 Tax=Rhodoblastus sp. TaxID=1962975 RepID=UPI0035B44C83
MQANRVTTGLELPGFRVVRNIGIVRGITVRSRSVVGNLAGAFQIFFGGNISVYTNLCEKARTEAYEMMCQHAVAVGANAIVMMRYDANEILSGVTEVICYGTAVVVEQETQP